MTGFFGFGVDLDELARSIDEMARCRAALDVLLEEVTHSVTGLHVTWTGSAATAQAAAQAEWQRGFREMSAALAAMRGAADTAHDNYSSAVTTNVQMWEQVS